MGEVLSLVSGFDAVMAVIAVGVVALTIYLLAAVKRLRFLREMQATAEVASILTQTEVDSLLGFRSEAEANSDKDRSP